MHSLKLVIPNQNNRIKSLIHSFPKGNKGILRLYGLKKVNCYKLFMQT